MVFVANDAAFRADVRAGQPLRRRHVLRAPRRRGRDAHAAPGHAGGRRGHLLAGRTVADRGRTAADRRSSCRRRRPTTAVAANWSANPAITGTPGLANSAPVIPDTANPTTAITAPVAGASVYGPVTVTASASRRHRRGVGRAEGRRRRRWPSTRRRRTASPGTPRRSARTRCRRSPPTAPARPASSAIVNVTVPVDSTPPGAPGTPVASNVGADRR